jgi:hypothetical protein
MQPEAQLVALIHLRVMVVVPPCRSIQFVDAIDYIADVLIPK